MALGCGKNNILVLCICSCHHNIKISLSSLKGEWEILGTALLRGCLLQSLNCSTFNGSDCLFYEQMSECLLFTPTPRHSCLHGWVGIYLTRINRPTTHITPPPPPSPSPSLHFFIFNLFLHISSGFFFKFVGFQFPTIFTLKASIFIPNLCIQILKDAKGQNVITPRTEIG
ncbi:hypothetical protein QVD17_20707 [Tagetes erecta]|uniref:Uncharacterized protein n=1 Tax=Tagetes erecta TaxID=13708 RepID=A0AAD8NYG4_TARER|nr:hypothetical protein QVD17_20707 [Tagetes erecta]